MSITKKSSKAFEQAHAMIDAKSLAKACKIAGVKPCEFLAYAVNALSKNALENEDVVRAVFGNALKMRKKAPEKKSADQEQDTLYYEEPPIPYFYVTRREVYVNAQLYKHFWRDDDILRDTKDMAGFFGREPRITVGAYPIVIFGDWDSPLSSKVRVANFCAKTSKHCLQ